jgi:phage-related protein
MSTKLLREGQQTNLEGYLDRGGECPFQGFVDGLQRFEKARLWRLLDRIADVGIPRNPELFRYEGRQVYAIKAGPVRVYCFFKPRAPRKTLVLTHGIYKKSRKMPKGELEKALKAMNEIFSEEG